MKTSSRSISERLHALALAALLTFVSFAPIACAKKPVVVPEPPAPEPPKAVSFRFPQPLVVETPAGDPTTAQEHILCGLFYFEHGRYEEAAGEFSLARARITDFRNRLSRDCLVSEAVCYLLTDNKAAFVQAVNTLRATYTHYELMAIENQDRRLRALTDISNAFGQIGYK